MDKKIKCKWVKALRSGKYEQATGRLRKPADDDDAEFKYCCLGVLHCGVLGKRLANNWQEWLSGATLKEVGLSRTAQEELYELNDGGASFTDIADYIEKNL